MEAYDLVIHKTVKDLFKSNNLNQILKYKQNKEKEVIEKEENMKKLILDKYPFLIKSLSNLEEIYSNIPTLEKLRFVFQSNIEELKILDENSDLFELDCNDNDIFEEFSDYLESDKANNLCIEYDENGECKSNSKFDEDKIVSKIEGMCRFIVFIQLFLNFVNLFLDELFTSWDLISKKDVLSLVIKLHKIEKLISYYVLEKKEIFIKQNSDSSDHNVKIFLEALMREIDFLFLNEFRLLNKEFLNLVIKKILSEKLTNSSNNYTNSFYENLKYLLISILINCKIETNFNLNGLFKSNNEDHKDLIAHINKFIFESEIFRKVLLNKAIKYEELLNTKEINISEALESKNEIQHSLNKIDKNDKENSQSDKREEMKKTNEPFTSFSNRTFDINLFEDNINIDQNKGRKQ